MDTKALITLSSGTETKKQKGGARWPHADFAREKDNLYVGSIEKAICILYAFGKGRSELRLNEIAEITGLGRRAAQRSAIPIHCAVSDSCKRSMMGQSAARRREFSICVSSIYALTRWLRRQSRI